MGGPGDPGPTRKAGSEDDKVCSTLPRTCPTGGGAGRGPGTNSIAKPQQASNVRRGFVDNFCQRPKSAADTHLWNTAARLAAELSQKQSHGPERSVAENQSGTIRGFRPADLTCRRSAAPTPHSAGSGRPSGPPRRWPRRLDQSWPVRPAHRCAASPTGFRSAWRRSPPCPAA